LPITQGDKPMPTVGLAKPLANVGLFLNDALLEI
jgi:hypothetical protein